MKVLINIKNKIIKLSCGLSLLIPLIFLPTLSIADQIREVSGNDELLFEISQKHPTRLSVQNDKIQSLQFKAGILDVSKNDKLGEAYITPRHNTKTINLFISTKKGFVYKLLLKPTNIPSAQIILQNKNTYISSNISKGASNDYERRMADIILAMQQDLPVENCMMSKTKKKITSPMKGVRLKVLAKYLCKNFVGYKIKIRNKDSIYFTEKDFVTPKTSAVKIYNNHLFMINKDDK